MEPSCEQYGRGITEGFLSTGASSPSPEGATQLSRPMSRRRWSFITKLFHKGATPHGGGLPPLDPQ
ncbi:hypothetical protein HS1genome_2219 [Sulfodiicoccus acidiphilus]|uniref:Uncharacterized protein n=1 Tax=Sulfodiicoccus acidiphilus TaxID=1670455 RepID=A0A348B6M8_9CREN|nr:hypothetical protein HS1genome_2219 [Sulfodiicoccus acidiphilus]